MPELTLSAIGIVLIAASFFKICRVRNITVAYKDENGRVHGYAVKDTYNLGDSWIDVENVEKYIAEKKQMEFVKVVQIKVKSGLVLRRA